MVIHATRSGREWVFITKVNNDEGNVYYKCCWAYHAELHGDWQPNPTRAYKTANAALIAAGLGNPNYNPKEKNGARLVGIAYPSVQRAICEHFALELAVRARLLGELCCRTRPTNGDDDDEKLHQKLQLKPPPEEEETAIDQAGRSDAVPGNYPGTPIDTGGDENAGSSNTSPPSAIDKIGDESFRAALRFDEEEADNDGFVW